MSGWRRHRDCSRARWSPIRGDAGPSRRGQRQLAVSGLSIGQSSRPCRSPPAPRGSGPHRTTPKDRPRSTSAKDSARVRGRREWPAARALRSRGKPRASNSGLRPSLRRGSLRKGVAARSRRPYRSVTRRIETTPFAETMLRRTAWAERREAGVPWAPGMCGRAQQPQTPGVRGGCQVPRRQQSASDGA